MSNNHSKANINSIIRVNLAGEYGAVRIYKGQIDALKRQNNPNSEHIKELEKMLAQEEIHLRYFEKKLVNNKVRPTLFQPLWHIMGYTMGYLTASIGIESAMACTVAVEETIDDHYQSQLQDLENFTDQDLTQNIKKFRQEELEHRDTALEHNAKKAPLYPLLYNLVQKASKTAIWLSKRI